MITKRISALAFALVLVAGSAGADIIRYHPPQSIRLSNGVNAEYGEISWATDVFTFQTVANGGTGRSININAAVGGVVFSLAGTGQWTLDGTQFYPNATDSENIGVSNKFVKDIFIGRSFQGSKAKSLTDAAAATAYATIAVPTNGQIAGELIWTATSSAAAVRFVANGSIRFWGTDEGGTPVCGINKIGTDGEGHSSGAATLVCTWTNVVATTNCALSVTCTNSTAGVDPVTINGRLDMPTTATVTFN